MSMCIVLLLMIAVTGILSEYFTGRKAVESTPIFASAITIILYLFYCVDRLQAGYLTVLLLIAAASLLAIAMLFIRRKSVSPSDIIRRLFSPGFIIFFILCMFYWMLVRNNQVLSRDELRLWGAYPKALFFSEKLQVGADALLYGNMQSYVPGMPLFCYFIEKLNGSFTSGLLYWSYAVFGALFLLPMTKKLSYKKEWHVLASLLLLFAVPMFFGNSGYDGLYAYRSLYIDPMLGLLFACCMYYAVIYDGSVFELVRLSLALGTLSLLKDSDFALALMCCFVFLILRMKKSCSVSFRKKLASFSVFICPIVVYLIWQSILKQIGIESHISLTGGSHVSDAAFLPVFLKALLKTDIVASPVCGNWGGPDLMTYATTGLFCLFLCILTIGLFDGKRKQKTKIASRRHAVLQYRLYYRPLYSFP